MYKSVAPFAHWQSNQAAEYADIVIVGNGIAGLTAAIEARHLAPDRSIVLITDQPHPTIHTPALKQFAIGKVAQEQLLAYPAGTERKQRIHVVNARVEGINAQGKYLHIQGGYGFGYNSLLLATGSIANGLPLDFPGRDFDGVLTLHRLQDYLNLRRRLPEVASAVVIGGGVHAIETVMALLYHGIEVHWLIRGTTFHSKVLDSASSQLVLEHVEHAGAKIYTNTQAIGVVGRLGSTIGVVTNQNRMIPCQMVLVCTGTSPNTTLAQHCSVPMLQQHGILVDEQLRTSVRDIYAVGDVAALKNPQTGTYETHAQWYAAVQQGRVVAAAMTGHYDRAQHAFGVPWHATNVGELYMLTVGTPQTTILGATTLTDRGKKRYRRMTIVGDKLVGYLSLGTVQPDSLAIKRLIDEGHSINSVKKSLLKGNFDARKFFSQRQSCQMQEMVTSSKLPAIVPSATFAQQPGRDRFIASADHPLIPVGRDRFIASADHPLIPVGRDRFIASANDHLLASTPETFHPSVQPLPQPAPQPFLQPPTTDRRRASEQKTIHQIEQPVPVMPVQREPQTEPRRDTRPLFASIYHQATLHIWDETPSLRPTTDPLPTHGSTGKKVVESMLLPLPTRPVTHKLWDYSQKVPAVTAQKTASTDAKTKDRTTGEKSTNFLL